MGALADPVSVSIDGEVRILCETVSLQPGRASALYRTSTTASGARWARAAGRRYPRSMMMSATMCSS